MYSKKHTKLSLEPKGKVWIEINITCFKLGDEKACSNLIDLRIFGSGSGLYDSLPTTNI